MQREAHTRWAMEWGPKVDIGTFSALASRESQTDLKNARGPQPPFVCRTRKVRHPGSIRMQRPVVLLFCSPSPGALFSDRHGDDRMEIWSTEYGVSTWRCFTLEGLI